MRIVLATFLIIGECNPTFAKDKDSNSTQNTGATIQMLSCSAAIFLMVTVPLWHSTPEDPKPKKSSANLVAPKENTPQIIPTESLALDSETLVGLRDSVIREHIRTSNHPNQPRMLSPMELLFEFAQEALYPSKFNIAGLAEEHPDAAAVILTSLWQGFVDADPDSEEKVLIAKMVLDAHVLWELNMPDAENAPLDLLANTLSLMNENRIKEDWKVDPLFNDSASQFKSVTERELVLRWKGTDGSPREVRATMIYRTDPK